MAGFDDLQKAIDTVAVEKAGLDQQFSEARSVIESQYELSETPAEREAVRGLLNELAEASRVAQEQLAAQYGQARTSVLDRLATATGTGRDEVESVASMFEQSYVSARQQEEAAAQESGLGGIPVWNSGAPQTGAGARIAESAGIEARAEGARNQLLQDDLGWLGDTLLGEAAAQRGDTQRLGMQMASGARRDHNTQVQARIQQERMQQAQQVGALQGQFTGREFELGSEQRGLMTTLAQMRQQAAENEKNRQHQAAMAAAARSSSGGGGGGRSRGGGGGGGSSSGGSGGPTAAGVGVNLDALNKRAEATASYNTSMSADAAERWNERGRTSGGTSAGPRRPVADYSANTIFNNLFGG